MKTFQIDIKEKDLKLLRKILNNNFIEKNEKINNEEIIKLTFYSILSNLIEIELKSNRIKVKEI